MAHKRMKTRSSPFNRCNETKDGKAYKTYPTYASNANAHILAKLKLQYERANKDTCHNENKDSCHIYI